MDAQRALVTLADPGEQSTSGDPDTDAVSYWQKHSAGMTAEQAGRQADMARRVAQAFGGRLGR